VDQHNHAEHLRQHDEILRSLTAMLVKQDGINDRLTLAIERIDHSIERIDHSIERIDRTLAHVEITQARMETFFTRLFRPEDNGRDA
jgi:hypothetical protein